jgi:putative oxidoreductase
MSRAASTHRSEKTGTKSLLAALVRTDDALWPLILRVTAGIVVLPHGIQKVSGFLGGWGGIGGTLRFFTDVLHLPAFTGVFATISDFAGAIGLLAGVFTRVAAAGTIVVMIGAMVTLHVANGFFMNWGGTQAGEGYEYHLLVIGMMTALMLGGGGRGSVDRSLGRALDEPRA